MRVSLLPRRAMDSKPFKFLAFSAVAMLALSGCIADKATERIAIELVDRRFGDMGVLVASTQMFISSKERLPENYAELRDFISSKYGSDVKLPNYDEVAFSQLQTGRTRVVRYVMTQGVTNSTSFTFGEPSESASPE